MSTDEIPVPEKETPKTKKGNIATSDANLLDQSNKVNETWKITPGITLLWTDTNEFGNTIEQFGSSLGQRMSKGGERRVETTELNDLDESIDQHTDYIKLYNKEKYGKKNFKAYFAQFGIEKVGKNYTFPKDRQKRRLALELALKAIVKNGFQDKEFGLEFWRKISDDYTAALDVAAATDSNVSGLVKTKNQNRKTIRLTLNSLIHIIKGNYPFTYKSVLREWGFHKEKY